MNVLITGPGRNYRLVELLRRELNGAGQKLVAVDESKLCPALYAADRAYILPAWPVEEYITSLLKICAKEEIKVILAQGEQDLAAIAQAAQRFREMGVLPLLAGQDAVVNCADPYRRYHFLATRGFACPRAYADLELFLRALEHKELDFPVIVTTSSPLGFQAAVKCPSLAELHLLAAVRPDLTIQEVLKGEEYGVDLYVDAISHQVVAAFAKRRYARLNGVTDKALSVKDERLLELAAALARSLGVIGPLNLGICKVGDDYYVEDVKLHFGSSYFAAFDCGVNFCPLIINNIRGIANQVNLNGYAEDIFMLKYDKIMIKRREEMVS